MIVGGVPAKPIRLRFNEALIARLLASEWWNYHPRILREFGFEDMDAFCDQFDAAREAGNLAPFTYGTLTWDILKAELDQAE